MFNHLSWETQPFSPSGNWDGVEVVFWVDLLSATAIGAIKEALILSPTEFFTEAKQIGLEEVGLKEK